MNIILIIAVVSLVLFVIFNKQILALFKSSEQSTTIPPTIPPTIPSEEIKTTTPPPTTTTPPPTTTTPPPTTAIEIKVSSESSVRQSIESNVKLNEIITDNKSEHKTAAEIYGLKPLPSSPEIEPEIISPAPSPPPTSTSPFPEYINIDLDSNINIKSEISDTKSVIEILYGTTPPPTTFLTTTQENTTRPLGKWKSVEKIPPTTTTTPPTTTTQENTTTAVSSDKQMAIELLETSSLPKYEILTNPTRSVKKYDSYLYDYDTNYVSMLYHTETA